MPAYFIQGGKKLRGEIIVNTAKNSAVALISATLLVRGKVTLYDVPRVDDVHKLLDILSSIGVQYAWKNKHTLSLDTSADLHMEDLDQVSCSMIRSSLFLLGALSHRTKQFTLYHSGGCELGERTVRPHLYALQKLGVKVTLSGEYYEVRNSAIKGSEVIMYEAGDTPTENAIMAAVLGSGTTVIKYASANYMVQDLCYFLKKAGANITGIGTATLKITGVKKLKPVSRYHIMPDPLEAMAFISLSITTKSKLTVKNCPLEFLELELEKLSVMGQKMEFKNRRISESGHFFIVDILITPSHLIALPDKIHAMPFPGINIDNIPFFVPIATQAKGRTLIHDWMYENRATQYLPFAKLGAKLDLLDPHRIFVEGPCTLKPRNLVAPNGIRPAMALCIGMLAAHGNSTLDNIHYIERGYEDLPQRLQSIGARIEYIS